MKKTNIAFWVSTSIIFLMEGVMPALTFNTEMAKAGIAHLQYPAYFGQALVLFKVLGALSLILPQVPTKMKEWAYAGFTFNLLFAFWSHYSVDGLVGDTFAPLTIIAVLMTSYVSWNKRKANAA